MLTLKTTLGLSVLAAGALALAGCGGSDDGNGLLTVQLTDSPVDDAAEVVVVFTGLELKPAGGEPISVDYDEPRSIDLLQLQDGTTEALLEDFELGAGQYNWIRLKVLAEQDLQDGSYIRLETTGERFPLWIPSGSESGLKLVRPFIVSQQGTTEIVIDFDLRKSVIAPPGLAPNYILKPALRMVDSLLVGRVVGTVDLAYLAELQEAETCSGGVYVFEGGAANPDDMDGDPADGDDPLVYKLLEADEIDGTLASYVIPFLEEGEYTVAFTCDYVVDVSPEASEYDPTAEDGEGFGTMRWTTFENVPVEAPGATTVDVLPAD
ncbi:DUF4382 domain-containing protein [Thioalkalivibrio sp. XN279]|uniref:DUF4382 domain-containing protein n=1 Tax=Thioalkalivibrio sp. XN279 TaxID=2714953 RepID=UPI00140AA3F0|nr:DUF4382 domain-containing protein [Thioalkalivibrio sp. XN279]NHA15507.1 DUF4382 domain-containing protein [Thioalkalivibrio sp. XN279]